MSYYKREANKLHGKFQIFPLRSNKKPTYTWGGKENTKLTLEQLNYMYDNVKGIIPGTDIEFYGATHLGIATGHDGLEVVDVDLKAYKTAEMKTKFWKEFIGLLEDNIYDFYSKFALYRTKNDGYHILYRIQEEVTIEGQKDENGDAITEFRPVLVDGNRTFSRVTNEEGNMETLIESRGFGGFVMAYPDKHVKGLTYSQIDYITKDDYDILIHIAKMFNETKDVVEVQMPKETKQSFSANEVKTWKDFNDKNTILDVCGDEFKIVHRSQSNGKTYIKRHGAKSPHSGYIYADSGKMFLFSTNTNYPAETALTPFAVYAHKYHGGDFNAAQSDLYKKDYGSRFVPEIKIDKAEIKEATKAVDFPIDIFPLQFQRHIIEGNKVLGHCTDFMACSLLWAISVSIGKSRLVQTQKGKVSSGIVWVTLVGSPGVGKTPSVDFMLKPLQDLRDEYMDTYNKQLKEFKNYEKLGEAQKKKAGHLPEPVSKQFIVSDATIESVFELHNQNDNSLGYYRDELASWLKDMNKYKEGSDMQHWLSTWSGQSIVVNRVTKQFSVKSPHMPVIGGIQPRVLHEMATKETEANGFIDRVIFSYPNIKAEYMNDNEMDENDLNLYNEDMKAFYKFIQRTIVRDKNNNIDPYVYPFSEGAKKLYFAKNKVTVDEINSLETNEALKSALSKVNLHIVRLAILIEVFNDYFGRCKELIKKGHDPKKLTQENLFISEDSMEKAIRLSDYFWNTKMRIFEQQSNEIILNGLMSKCKGANNTKKIEAILNSGIKISNTEIASFLKVSAKTVQRAKKAYADSKK